MSHGSYLDPMVEESQKAIHATLELEELQNREQTKKVRSKIKEVTKVLSKACDKADRIAEKKNKKNLSNR